MVQRLAVHVRQWVVALMTVAWWRRFYVVGAWLGGMLVEIGPARGKRRWLWMS